jgi:hypothetical protein
MDTRRDKTQIWGKSGDEDGTFDENGDISLVSVGENGRAATVDGDRIVAEKFLHDPSVLTRISTLLTNIDSESAHAYAQTSAESATDIDPANGAGCGRKMTFSFVKNRK